VFGHTDAARRGHDGGRCGEVYGVVPVAPRAHNVQARRGATIHDIHVFAHHTDQRRHFARGFSLWARNRSTGTATPSPTTTTSTTATTTNKATLLVSKVVGNPTEAVQHHQFNVFVTPPPIHCLFFVYTTTNTLSFF
jgi:hypothetical protein